MSKELLVKLNMGERFQLQTLLPEQGNYITFKALRKLKETLAPSDEEYKEYEFKQAYQCPNVEYDNDGRKIQCEYSEVSDSVVVCPIHNKVCNPTNQLFWKNELVDKQKEIYISKVAEKVILEILQRKNVEEELSEQDGTLALYEKFIGDEE